MKKIILSTIISSVLILGVVKYEDILNKASNTIQVQKETKKLSQENKKKALYNRLQSYSKYGFDINQTSPNSYLITVKDSKKSAELFLNIFNLGYSLDSEDKQELQQVFKDARFDVSVDWDKYISDAPRSVEVNYIGKGDESKPFAKLLMDKKVGAYLTYQGNAELKKIEFKNLSETLSENNESVALLLNDTIIDIKQLLETIIPKFSQINFNITGNCKVYADDALRSVFSNLISNSIHHGKSNEITINISSNNNICEIEYSDNGTGIPDKIKNKIFDEGFHYGKSGNTGIGLFIVEKTISLYKGSISVIDNQTEGAHFLIKLNKAISS